jgi:RNA polymerase sigma-70 factor (ECF subfamily)
MCKSGTFLEYMVSMNQPDLHEEFMTSFITAEPKLRAYAFACGLSREQADDLVQEEALVLWRRYDSYDRTRPFLPWALGVAHHLIQKCRQASHATHLLSPEVAEQMAQTCSSLGDEIEQRQGALRNCVEKLPGHLRSLLALRYGEQRSLAQIAQRLGRGLSATNMALHRIRHVLLECVEREGAQ